ncbi:MAG: class I SAM-dependent methyltransferase [Candidatus Binataceae bacterium]
MRCYGPEYFRRADVLGRIGPGVDYRTSAADIAAGRVKGYAEITANFELTGKAVLEVGCATGALLQSLVKHAPAVLIGIDIAAQQVAYGREHYGLDLRCTKLEDAGFAPGAFDLIVMLDVLEHVWDTRAFFSAAAFCLKEGGALFIRTPNADSYRVAGQRWNYLHCGLEHVAYLSRTGLAILARDHDMVVERAEANGCPSYIPYVRRRKLAKLILEPAKALSNQLERWRWRLASASQRERGLDMRVIVRKQCRTLRNEDVSAISW